MPPIARLHWTDLPATPTDWTPAGGRLRALWPEPIDYDACFQELGFTACADSDAAWDDDFAALVQRVVAHLAQLGSAAQLHGVLPRNAPPAAPVDALLAAARDDQFPPCVIGLGAPPGACVATSDGHPMLWVWTAAAADDLLPAVAGSWPVAETPLALAPLLPRVHRPRPPQPGPWRRRAHALLALLAALALVAAVAWATGSW